MKIYLNKPLLIQPENLPLISNGKSIQVRQIIENVRQVAVLKNDSDREFYKYLIEKVMDNTSEFIELNLPKADLLKQWIYKTEMIGIIIDAIVGLLNGETIQKDN